MPMPSSGGTLLHQMLKMVENYPLSSYGFLNPSSVQREETVRDTVRSTEVDVDNINTQNKDTNYNRGSSDLDDDGDLGTDNRTGGRTTF
jgi:gamma-glutamyltranspeptidase